MERPELYGDTESLQREIHNTTQQTKSTASRHGEGFPNGGDKPTDGYDHVDCNNRDGHEVTCTKRVHGTLIWRDDNHDTKSTTATVIALARVFQRGH